jgi:hypothetical protein
MRRFLEAYVKVDRTFVDRLGDEEIVGLAGARSEAVRLSGGPAFRRSGDQIADGVGSYRVAGGFLIRPPDSRGGSDLWGL